MKMIRKVFMMAIVFVFSFSSFSIGADPLDPNDPRWYALSFHINPKGTYFRTCHDEPHKPTMLDMNYYDTYVNDLIVMRRKGAYVPGPGYTDVQADMAGIFSPSGNVLPDSETRLNRVPDAVGVIPAYPDNAGTAPTWFKCGDPPEHLTTDIPNDFWICCSDRAALVKVPARFLFVSGVDGYWKDNYDPNLDYKIEFSDDVKWHQHSKTCSTCWNDGKNWDVEVTPFSNLGVTFDEAGSTLVDNYDDTIKYLRIVNEAYVQFIDAGYLDITGDNVGYHSILVDEGATMNFGGGGTLVSGNIGLGYKSRGDLIIKNGSKAYPDDIYVADDKGSSGQLSVENPNTELFAFDVRVGEEGSGHLEVKDWAVAKIQNLLEIGNIGKKSGLAIVNVKTGGHLKGDYCNIYERGMFFIDRGMVTTINLSVYDGGILRGCNTGSITSLVYHHDGGFVEAGCPIFVSATYDVKDDGRFVPNSSSTGSFIIDGDYIQEIGAILVVKISGYIKVEDYDVLEVTGDVKLGGTLQLNFINEFSPKKGDIFEFMQIGGTATGSFSDVVINGLGDGFQYDISIEGGVTKLTALNDGDTKKFPWAMFLPAFIGSEK